MNWFKTNSELKKELKKLKERNLLSENILSTTNETLKTLSKNYDRAYKERAEFEKRYNELKKEAITHYKSDMLENSLKIIGAFLNNKKPDTQWIAQQRIAQRQLVGLGQAQYPGGLLGLIQQ